MSMPDNGTWLVELATGKMYVVTVERVDDESLWFSECSWVADTGIRLGEFVKSGPQAASEIEKMVPGGFPRALLCGFWRWPHVFPESQ